MPELDKPLVSAASGLLEWEGRGEGDGGVGSDGRGCC